MTQPPPPGRPDDQPDADRATVDPTRLEGPIEALLLLTDQGFSTADLAEALGVPTAPVEQALANLSGFYDRTGRGFQLRHVGGGWRFWTRPEHADLIAAWVRSGQQNRLSQAALETLSVIAYLQPISRGRISAIRGVNVDSVVRTLVARELVEERTAPGQSGATLFVTTDYFLERMGLVSLDELPPLAPLLPDAVELEAELSRLGTSLEEGPDGVPSRPTISDPGLIRSDDE